MKYIKINLIFEQINYIYNKQIKIKKYVKLKKWLTKKEKLNIK